MKHENSLRLASLASRNTYNGSASALVIAKRMERITGSDAGIDIVSRVYSHPQGRAAYCCRECGSQHLTPDSAEDCCGREGWQN